MNPITSGIETTRETVKAWERLRLVYNVVLLLAGLPVVWLVLDGDFPPMGPFPNSPLELVFDCVVFGLLANVFFCLGPYAEFVVVAIGFPLTARKIRYALFGLGLLVSLGLIGLVVLLLPFAALSIPGP